jgi:predicted aspartyl protease
MEIDTMGRVLVTATIENLIDLFNAEQGLIQHQDIRRVEVDNALVDTGATILSMPKRLIQQLGLRHVRTRMARTAAGTVSSEVYGTVRLTIQGRECPIDVDEVPDDCPVLVGQIPLELLDFVVDLRNQRLIGNPEHGGEHILEMY